MRRSPKSLKVLAYFSLVRSKLEYSASIWDPYLQKDITKLEQVQRRAARFVSNDYRYRSSVTSMLQELGWKDLSSRRRDIRLALFYKVVHHLVAVPIDDKHLEKADPRTRANSKHKYRLTTISKCEELRSFFYSRTVPDWNKLPASTVEAPSIDVFKQRLSPTAQPACGAAGLMPASCQ